MRFSNHYGMVTQYVHESANTHSLVPTTLINLNGFCLRRANADKIPIRRPIAEFIYRHPIGLFVGLTEKEDRGASSMDADDLHSVIQLSI